MTQSLDLSMLVAVYRRHGPPNLQTLADSMDAAADGVSWELIVALNGVSAEDARVPTFARTRTFDLNQGVPIAWNAAARLAGGDMLCVINDDVLLGPGSLRMLHDALVAEPKAGVVGPVGTTWDINAARHVSYLDVTGKPTGTMIACDVLSGWLLMTRRQVFEAVGGFDEGFTPCGFEEVDYCTAVRRRLGLKPFVVVGVPARHDFAVSARPAWRRVRFQGRSESLGSIHRRNKQRFLAKWNAHV